MCGLYRREVNQGMRSCNQLEGVTRLGSRAVQVRDLDAISVGYAYCDQSTSMELSIFCCLLQSAQLALRSERTRKRCLETISMPAKAFRKSEPVKVSAGPARLT